MGHEIAGVIMKYKKNKLVDTKKKILLGADIPNKENKDFALGHELDGGFQNIWKFHLKILKTFLILLHQKKLI